MITIHSDDFGYKKYSDKKIIQLIRKDRIKSVSVLINMCDKTRLNSLVKLVQSKPHIKTGLHLNLLEGKSLDQKDYIPTLVNGRSNFPTLKKLVIKLLLRLINPEHIEREVKKQIQALKQAGIKISFIDSHQHLHAISPIAEIVAKVARDENIPVIRSYKKIKTYTLSAKLKFFILKSAAYLTYLIYYGKLKLPISWNTDSPDSYSFMSWEGKKFDFSRVKDKKLIVVAHPFLPFDTNKSYLAHHSWGN